MDHLFFLLSGEKVGGCREQIFSYKNITSFLRQFLCFLLKKNFFNFADPHLCYLLLQIHVLMAISQN